MANNARKHTIPGGTDTTITRQTIFETFGNSIRDVVPVANTTARSQLVTDLNAVSQGPTSTRPLVVYRHDAPGLHRIEFSVDGTIWIPSSGVLRFASKAAADSWATSNGGYLTAGDTCFVGADEYTWTGTVWVGDWKIVVPSGTGFSPASTGSIRFRRIRNMVTAEIAADNSSWGAGNWSAVPIPVDHRPAGTIHATSSYNDVCQEVQFTAAGSVVVAKAGVGGIRVSATYPVG